MGIADAFTSGLAGPQITALAETLQEAVDEGKAALRALVEVPDLRSNDVPAWGLDILGLVMGLPRDPGWSDADYLYALRGQAITRNGHAMLRELYELAITLSPMPGSSVASGPVYAAVWIPGGSDLSTTRREILGQAFARAVTATSGLSVIALPATLSDMVFTLDDDLRGLDRGYLADTIYP